MKKAKKANGLIWLILAFLIVGIIGFSIGAKLMGWNIWSWFISKQAILVYLVFLFFGMFVGFNLWKGKNEQ